MMNYVAEIIHHRLCMQLHSCLIKGSIALAALTHIIYHVDYCIHICLLHPWHDSGNTDSHTHSSPRFPALQLSTYVSFWTADKFGRRALFLQAGVQMSLALLVIAISLKCLGGGQGTWLAWYILAMTCVYDM